MKTQMQETSLDAYRAVDLTKTESEVYEVIKRIQPCSNQDISKAIGWPINRVTGRTNGLVGKEKVIEHDRVKQNGRTVIRWKCSDNQLNLFQ